MGTIEAMRILSEKLTEDQYKWIEDYEDETSFDCLFLEELIDGAFTFEKFAQMNIDWYEDHSSDTIRRISNFPKSQEYWNNF